MTKWDIESRVSDATSWRRDELEHFRSSAVTKMANRSVSAAVTHPVFDRSFQIVIESMRQPGFTLFPRLMDMVGGRITNA